ncbi:MAG TPA: response regulator transcription factor [Solirubrobacteraceae bacterium]|nr:response regulator transcription factor [Solirubrobacteraceae bacterium]
MSSRVNEQSAFASARADGRESGGWPGRSVAECEKRPSPDVRASRKLPDPIRVLVVDDHPAVRWGLVQLLEDQPDIELAAVTATAETGLGQAEREGIDVAVVDYHLGGRNGLWLARKLKSLARPPHVVIFSAFVNDHLAANCIVAGVDAMLSKSSLGDELCNAIRSVHLGRRLLPRVPAAMADLLRRRLHEDERSAFGMLLAGLADAEVERTLGLSERELAARRAEMLVKLEALPGELTGARSGSGRPDFERLLPR